MALNIGAALIAANALGIAAIASMWKDPNAVVAAVDEVKKGKLSMSGPETSTSATAKFVSPEERRAEEARLNVQKLLKVLEDAQKDLKHKNAISAAVKKQLKDMQTLFPKATDQLASLTKQVSQTESDAAAAYLAVGTARTAYEQALEDFSALPLVNGPPPGAGGNGAGNGAGGAGNGAGGAGAGNGAGGAGAGNGAGGAGGAGAGNGAGGVGNGAGGVGGNGAGNGAGGVGNGAGGVGGDEDNGAGTGLRGVLLNDTARRKNEADEKIERLVHGVHPTAAVSQDVDGNPQVLVPIEGGGSEVWKVIVTGDTVKFQKDGTDDQVARIPRLNELAAAAAAAAADGFAGMLAIHPAQVAVINRAFAPDAAALAEAQAIVDAFAANPGAGVLQINGRMIDQPHVRQARALLGLAPETAV